MAGTATSTRKVVFRESPSFECFAFHGLLGYVPELAQHLGISGDYEIELIPAGRLDWSKYAGRNPEELEAEGKLFFDVAERRYDQHGKDLREEEVARLSQLLGCPIKDNKCCSLDRLLLDFNYLERHPKLRTLHQIIRDNDISGRSVSRNKDPEKRSRNFRAALAALNAKYPHKPERVLEFARLGFLGAFTLVEQSEKPVRDPFGEDALIKGVKMYTKADKQFGWFFGLLRDAWDWEDRETRRALMNFRHWRGEGKGPITLEVDADPALGRKLRICAFRSKSYLAGKITRMHDFDIAIVGNPDGHMMVMSNIIRVGKEKKRLHLGPVAKALRLQEIERVKTTQPGFNLTDTDLEVTSFLSDGGLIIPWYFAEFWTMVANGTKGNSRVAKTRLTIVEILNIMVAALPACKLF